jgi:hypothetical protein
MSSITRIPVQNEAAAWRLLDDAIKGKLPKEAFQLDIGDWTNLNMKFVGYQFDSSLTPTMMEAFIELQKSIYRLFGKLYYNNYQSRIITDEQRKALEIIIKVSPGSSDLTAILNDAVQKLTSGAINKLEAKHWVIILLSGILGITSTVMWKDYLKTQGEIKNADVHVNLSREETKRLDIVTAAMKEVPHATAVRSDSNEFKNSVLKSAKSADNIQIAEQTLNKTQVSKMVKNTRTQSIEARLDGKYKIIKVDSSDIDKFTVVLQNRRGDYFPAVLQNDTVSRSRNMERLQEAEWNRNYINLEVNGRKVRGEVTKATILGIKED